MVWLKLGVCACVMATPGLFMSIPPKKQADGKSTHQTELKLVFFDNARFNIVHCDWGSTHYKLELSANRRDYYVSVDCVDVGECARERDKDQQSMRSGAFHARMSNCHRNYVQNLNAINEDPRVLLVIRALEDVARKLTHRLAFFDDESGVIPEELAKHRGCHVWVFDWDKTISQCDGLLAVSPRNQRPRTAMNPTEVELAWSEHSVAIYTILRTAMAGYPIWPHVENHEVQGQAFLDMYYKNPEVVLKAMCGGTQRVEALRNEFRHKTAGDASDIYVITANPARCVISKLAMTLYPPILDHQVVSPNQYDPGQVDVVFENVGLMPLSQQNKYMMLKTEVLPSVQAKLFRRPLL